MSLSGSRLTIPAIPHIDQKPNHRLHRFEKKICGSNFKGAALSERIKHTERCAARCRQFIETNRRCTTFEDACANRAHLCLLTLILCLQCHLLLACVLVERRAAIVVKYKHFARAEYLNTFLRQPFVALAQIRHRAIRSIRKSQGDKNRVGIDDLARLSTHRFRKDKHRRCSRQILHQIDEMTDLANNPPATLLSVLCPVFLWNATSVHAIEY